MHALPAGPDAVLLDFAAADDPAAAVGAAVRALTAAQASGSLTGIDELTPGASTLLVQCVENRGVDMLGIHRAMRADLSEVADGDTDAPPIEIPVVYDGADLAEVASTLDVEVAEIVRIHRDTLWRVEFLGFAPGFGYLVPQARESGAHSSGTHPFDVIGRRAESRHRVPAGSVAIAAGYSAVYPRESPGGWYLLGHTDIRLWDTHSIPPALLSPGARVRFVDEGKS